MMLVKHGEEADFTKPVPPTKAAAAATKKKGSGSDATEESTYDSPQWFEFKAELDIYHRKLDKYNADKAKVFVVIIGQCTVGVKSWLANGNGLDTLEKNRDVVGLLKKLKEMAFSTGGEQDAFLTLNLSLRRLVTIQQGPKEQVAKYYERFKVAADVLKGHWGNFVPTNLVKDNLTNEETTDRFLGRIFLMGADKMRFGHLLDELNNNFISGTDRYPKTLELTLRLLSKYQGNQKKPATKLDDSEERFSTSFAQGKTTSSKKTQGNRNRPPAPATGGQDSDGSADSGGQTNNRRSRSNSRARSEGWAS